ncbi:hypothetical protein H6784_04770 [Candidatus Nomurabacteria bacterium]|nr:hypothetical protein [Candidatus Kaiserbacteria bacterium]MCB9814702.1 hypothetical protein [Candidatus Nomurabacteria bacterium]
MPSPSDGEEKVVRRRRAPARVVADGDETPVAKRPLKTAVRKAPVKRAPRKVTPREIEKAEVRVDNELESVTRKAPTPIRSEQRNRQLRKKQIIIVASIILVGIGVSAAVGLSDPGQINVSQTVEARNERIRTNNTDERDENTSLVEVPVQNTSNAGKSLSGFVGIGSAKPDASKIEEKETASTTASTASSTEEVVASSTESVETGSVDVESIETGSNPEVEEAPSI